MGNTEARQITNAGAAGEFGNAVTTVSQLTEGRAAITYPLHDPKGRQYYEGEFVEGKRVGKGLLRWRNGVVYEGDWEEDNMHGKWGRMTWPEGLVYEGEWANGQMEGVGIMRRTQSTVNRKKKSTYAYQGEWKNGRRHGLGKQLFEEGDSEGRVSYEGEWRDGLRQGKGMMLWRDGSFYTGEWCKGVREGFGIFVDMGRDGERYEGHWHKDMREDECGLVVDKYNNEFRGTFVKDVKHGDGVLTFYHGRVRNEHWAWGHRTSDSEPPLHHILAVPSLGDSNGSFMQEPVAPAGASVMPSFETGIPSLVVICLEAIGRNKKLCKQIGLVPESTSKQNSNKERKNSERGSILSFIRPNKKRNNDVKSMCIALSLLRYQQQHPTVQPSSCSQQVLPQELFAKVRSFVGSVETGIIE